MRNGGRRDLRRAGRLGWRRSGLTGYGRSTWASGSGGLLVHGERRRIRLEAGAFDANARLLRPLPVGMLRKEFLVAIGRVGARGDFPIALFLQLHDARTRLRRELAVRVALDELVVRLDRVGGLGGLPVDLFATATCDERHNYEPRKGRPRQHARSGHL